MLVTCHPEVPLLLSWLVPSRFANFCIRGILGLVGLFTPMRRCPKGRMFSAEAFLILRLLDFLKSQHGC